MDTIASVSAEAWLPEQTESWDAFLAEVDRRCEVIFGGPLHEFAQVVFGAHTPDLFALLVDETAIKPSPWRETFRRLLTGETTSHTVDTVLMGCVPSAAMVPVRVSSAPRDTFTGHMDSRSNEGLTRQPAFPLDATQRLAAMYASTLQPVVGHCILPVNGPPGTGKTSFLKAVLATQWINAALAQAAHPPLVFATGATNKAVINVIEAFADVAGLDPHAVTGRWLDGLPSYGWFYPSKKAAEDNPSLMHLGYDEKEKSPFSAQGAATQFKNIHIEVHAKTYLVRARAALSLSGREPVDIAYVLSVLHQRMTEHQRAMKTEVVAFQQALDDMRRAVTQARRSAGSLAALTQSERSLLESLVHLESAQSVDRRALAAGALFLKEARSLLTGWRSWLPAALKAVFLQKRLTDLRRLSELAQSAFADASLVWSDVLPMLADTLQQLAMAVSSRQRRLEQFHSQRQFTQQSIQSLHTTRQQRHRSVQLATSMMHPVSQPLPGDASAVRSLFRLCGQVGVAQDNALDFLWARFDSRQDIEHRVPLFHLAARYWEGRWVSELRNDKPGTDHAKRLQRMMMLGVVVVATTHLIAKLGKFAKAHLLVMDEAGQCSPDVATSVLAVCETAVFVGDTKQLQPVSLMTPEKVAQIARQFGITPAELPSAFNPCEGSGMAVAQRGTHVHDSGDDPGITLLYHYRCHPMIIGYCNEMLYQNTMHIVRPNQPTLSALPPMSWVDVAGSTPTRQGGSWTNEAEVLEIIRWIELSAQTLCAAYGKPLDQIVAVITPLAAQAKLAKELLTERLSALLGHEVIERMTIGTVHRLQGAERAVIAFSLVQQTRTNPSLFADRDGGFLMNVAASRAKDAFIVFGDRATLNPAPSDQIRAQQAGTGPVAQLGDYLRRHGTRLYPRSLVVVEAPGKVKAVQAALGLPVAVLATSGTLMQSQLTPQGSLSWDAAPESFLASLQAHKGMLDEVVIATDDDIAGEMIGWQVATLACEHLSADLPVRRMRFHFLQAEPLRQSYLLAGANFDTDMLSAALLREFARHHDKAVFESALPDQVYVSAPRRDLTALVEREMRETLDVGHAVHFTASDEQGNRYAGFVPADGATLAGPKWFSLSQATALADDLRSSAIKPLAVLAIQQMPPLYPASTTLRMLSLAADELGMAPWDAQDHLNALYQDGGR